MQNPPPNPDGWREIADPDERLRTALTELYEWYAKTEPMMTNVTRDAPVVPAMAAVNRMNEAIYAYMVDVARPWAAGNAAAAASGSPLRLATRSRSRPGARWCTSAS